MYPPPPATKTSPVKPNANINHSSGLLFFKLLLEQELSGQYFVSDSTSVQNKTKYFDCHGYLLCLTLYRGPAICVIYFGHSRSWQVPGNSPQATLHRQRYSLQMVALATEKACADARY